VNAAHDGGGAADLLHDGRRIVIVHGIAHGRGQAAGDLRQSGRPRPAGSSARAAASATSR
jgi:hypothetical protein